MKRLTPNFTLVEQLSELKDQRTNISLQRLAYIKYAIANGDKTKGLQEMYDALMNITFDKNGYPRDNKSVFDYIQKQMKNNLGAIPGLPDNGTVVEIDKKIKALDELDPKTIQKYMKEVEKDITHRNVKNGKKEKKADFIEDMSDEELQKKLDGLINKEGLSNVIGLEKAREMSAEDKEKLQNKKENKEVAGESSEDKKKKEEEEKKKEVDDMGAELANLKPEDLE